MKSKFVPIVPKIVKKLGTLKWTGNVLFLCTDGNVWVFTATGGKWINQGSPEYCKYQEFNGFVPE